MRQQDSRQLWIGTCAGPAIGSLRDLHSFRGYCRGNDPRVGSPRRNNRFKMKADLKKADLKRADLKKADQKKADKRKADLKWADLISPEADCSSGSNQPLPDHNRPKLQQAQPSLPKKIRADQGPEGCIRPKVINSDPERSALSEGQVPSSTCQAHDVSSSTPD